MRDGCVVGPSGSNQARREIPPLGPRACSSREGQASGPVGREITRPRFQPDDARATVYRRGAGRGPVQCRFCGDLTRKPSTFSCAVGGLVVGSPAPGVCLPRPEGMLRAGGCPWPCFPAAIQYLRMADLYPHKREMRIQHCQWVERAASSEEQGWRLGTLAERDCQWASLEIEASLCGWTVVCVPWRCRRWCWVDGGRVCQWVLPVAAISAIKSAWVLPFQAQIRFSQAFNACTSKRIPGTYRNRLSEFVLP